MENGWKKVHQKAIRAINNIDNKVKSSFMLDLGAYEMDSWLSLNLPGGIPSPIGKLGGKTFLFETP